MYTFNAKNGASSTVAFYISISFSILVSPSKDLLQSSFQSRTELFSRKLFHGIKRGIPSRFICRNFRFVHRTKMVNFSGDTRIEKKKSVGDSFAIWPLRRYGFFFFFFLSITIIGDFSWDTSVVSLCPEVENRSRYRHFARLHAYRVFEYSVYQFLSFFANSYIYIYIF